MLRGRVLLTLELARNWVLARVMAKVMRVLESLDVSAGSQGRCDAREDCWIPIRQGIGVRIRRIAERNRKDLIQSSWKG